jgi:flagellar biosynthesis GTPase FlhF
MNPTKMLKPLPALAIALFLAAGEVPEAQAQGAPECSCVAMRNVKNRLCSVRAAQREFSRLMTKFVSAEKADGKPILLEDENKQKIKDCVQDALNTMTDREAQNASGETDKNCKITVKKVNPRHNASQCIEAIVRRHEEHHRAECLMREEDKWWKVWLEDAPAKSAMISTMYRMSAVDYMAEENTAYFQEEKELTETLRRLLKTCNDAYKVVEIEGDDHVPGKKTGDKYHLDPSVNPCPAPGPRTWGQCSY